MEQHCSAYTFGRDACGGGNTMNNANTGQNDDGLTSDRSSLGMEMSSNGNGNGKGKTTFQSEHFIMSIASLLVFCISKSIIINFN